MNGDEFRTRRLVLVHGFTQTHEVWQELADELADHLDVVAPDLPGHGTCNASSDNLDLRNAGRFIGGLGGPGVYVGYSLGARVLLHLALEESSPIEKLILVGARGGLSSKQERMDRRSRDDRLADRIERLGQEGLGGFIGEWLSGPVNERLKPAQQHREARERNRATGLAASLRSCGLGKQQPLWNRLHVIDVPTLIVYGEHDLDGIAEESMKISECIGDNAKTVCIDDAGHSLPWERSREFSRLIDAFIA